MSEYVRLLTYYNSNGANCVIKTEYTLLVPSYKVPVTSPTDDDTTSILTPKKPILLILNEPV